MTIKQEANLQKTIVLNKSSNQEIIIDQYKIIVESINKNNELRELANNFWATVNSLGIFAIAYTRDNQNLFCNQKPLIMWALIFLGFILCLSWLSYLRTIKQSIDHRYSLLLVMEKYLPFPIFQIFLRQSGHTGRTGDKNSLTIREMFVPLSFLLGYIFFSILLIFFNKEFSNSDN